jgi:hypothetical protein
VEKLLEIFEIREDKEVSATFSARNFFPSSFLSQHFLNFLPEPQGQGSFLPVFLFIFFESLKNF